MGVRLRYSITASISSTSAEEKDLGNLTCEVVDDDNGEGGVRKTLLAAGAVDVPIKMAEIAAARFVFIRTNTRDPTRTLTVINVKKNGVGGEIIAIDPLDGATEAHLLMVSSGITALYASNPGTVDVEVTVMCVGD